MRQAVIRTPESLELIEAPVPRLEGDGELLVRTAVSGICSGDLMPWYLARKIGTVLGHEVVGWAEEVGASVQGIRRGDLVFMHHHAPCGVCPLCRKGAEVHCPTWRQSKLDPGGMAEWIRVPAEIVQGDTFAVNDLSPERAVFIEPLGCCIKAFQRVPEVRGAAGVIVGCGIMGMLNLMTARALGVEQVITVEPDARRRQRSLEFGAHQALSPADAERSLRHQADFVIIGPGYPAVIQQALGYVRPGGTAVLFAPTPTGATTPLDLGELYFREVTIVPAYSCGPRETRAAHDLLARGLVEPERLITHRFPLTEVQQAFDLARSGGAVLKVVVTFPGGPSP